MKLLSNSLYSIISSVLPLVIAIFTVPLYLEVIGYERYGILAIAWLLLGYFGQADLGFGRAMTQRIASLTSTGGEAIVETFWSGMVSLAFVSLLAAIALFLGAQAYVLNALEVGPQLRREFLSATWILALTVPLVALSGGLSGALLGVQRFRAVSLVNLINGSTLLLLPLLAAQYVGTDISILFAAAFLSRVMGTIFLAMAVTRSLDLGWPTASPQEIRALTRFGAWIMVSALVGPLMIATDRFVIGGLAGAAAIAAYSIPYQLANRTLVFPIAIGQVLFPHFAAREQSQSREDCRTMSIFIGQIFAIPIVILVLLAEPAFELWLGDRLDHKSVIVGQILLIGFWLNAVALVPFSYIQARGDSRFTAFLHLAELPIYLAMLFGLGSVFGLAGIAVAFSARCLLDCLLLLARAKCADAKSIAHLGVSFALVLCSLAIVWPTEGLELQILGGITLAAVTLAVALFLMPPPISSRLSHFPMFRWLAFRSITK